jgi:3-hydroxyacyl-CoA dehydrogenase
MKIGIVGAGRMGVSLAHLNSSIGLETVVKVKPDAAARARAYEAISGSIDREVKRGRHTPAEAEAALARIRITGDYAELADCDVVIESVYEEAGAKREVLAGVQAVVGPQAVFASATSSIPATMLAENARWPGRVIVTHYIWPAHRARLVEMAAPSFAEPDAVQAIHDLLQLQGKRTITVQDVPGLLTTRVLAAYWSETVLLLQEGALPSQIDDALEAFGWPMGPCRMMDTVGFANMPSGYGFLYPHLGERVAGLALMLPGVKAGYVGHRAGQGFYIHDHNSWKPNSAMLDLIRTPGHSAPSDEEIVARTMGMIVCEAAHAIA